MIDKLALQVVSGSHHALGTAITLQMFGTNDDYLIRMAFDLIDRYEDLLTVNRDQSEVMSINHASHSPFPAAGSSPWNCGRYEFKPRYRCFNRTHCWLLHRLRGPFNAPCL